MAARTFLQLQDEALGDDFDATKYRTSVKRWLNEALWKFGRRVRVPQLHTTTTINTVAATATYALPTDLGRVLSLRNTADRDPLTEVSIDDLDDLPAASGKPVRFAIYANQIILHPTPDRVYPLELRDQRDGTELAADGDAPQLPDVYADALVSYARARLFRAEEDYQAAAGYMSDFNQAITDARVDLHGRDRARRRQVPGMFSGGSAGPQFTRPGG
jgi:hypothetical protein